MILALASALITSSPGAALAARLFDFSGPAYQILAPGESGGLPASGNSTDQGFLYDALTPLAGNVTAQSLERDFVSEKFGVTASTTVISPEPGLEIARDSYGVPHVFGLTRGEVMFGSGWIAAQDRGAILGRWLALGYAAALDVPGLEPLALLLTGRRFTPSSQAVKFVAAEKSSLLEKGSSGEQVVVDLEEWANGVNAYEATVAPGERLLAPVSAVDAIAGFALLDRILGNGGGGEVANSDFLARLEAKLGRKGGLKVFRDLREVNDPEAPVTTSKPFPYDLVPKRATPGAVVVDPGSMSASAVGALDAARASRSSGSSFLLAGRKHSADGHPLAVMGPQLGYFYPQLVMQGELHGGGVDAEGIIAPASPYVLIGRAPEFAWSLAGSGSQNTQQFLERLCSPNDRAPTRASEHYLYKGRCIAMRPADAGRLGAGNGERERELTFRETVHGPVSGTVTVKGRPYAVANRRSTRGRDPVSELALSDLDSNQVHSPQQFFRVANKLETPLNVSYVDTKHIAYFSSGRLPILARGTDPSLPTLGTGAYDWRGFLSQSQHPHDLAPRDDLLLNWNNKPAPEWGAASDNYSYGPVQRVELYSGFHSGMTEADETSIMNRAATEDLRARMVWPVIARVLSGGPAPSPLAAEAAGLINAWVARGASRLGPAGPEAPGAAVLDAAWRPIAEAVLSPVLGRVTGALAHLMPIDTPPSPSGSAYAKGWYGYVYKDLRNELGLPVRDRYSRRYCGSGRLKACRASLWAALESGAEALLSRDGTELAEWRAAPARIGFAPGLLPFSMRWTNRSSFQQVIEFTAQSPAQEQAKREERTRREMQPPVPQNERSPEELEEEQERREEREEEEEERREERG
jgi:hypothetical protein